MFSPITSSPCPPRCPPGPGGGLAAPPIPPGTIWEVVSRRQRVGPVVTAQELPGTPRAPLQSSPSATVPKVSSLRSNPRNVSLVPANKEALSPVGGFPAEGGHYRMRRGNEGPSGSRCAGGTIQAVEPGQLLLSSCVTLGRCLPLWSWFLFCTVRELAQGVCKVLPALLSSGVTLWSLSPFRVVSPPPSFLPESQPPPSRREESLSPGHVLLWVWVGTLRDASQGPEDMRKVPSK